MKTLEETAHYTFVIFIQKKCKQNFVNYRMRILFQEPDIKHLNRKNYQIPTLFKLKYSLFMRGY